jgi:hypothetical protein
MQKVKKHSVLLMDAGRLFIMTVVCISCRYLYTIVRICVADKTKKGCNVLIT